MTFSDLEEREKKLIAELAEITLQYRGALAEVRFWIQKQLEGDKEKDGASGSSK